MRSTLLVLSTATALILAGCGGSSSDASHTTVTTDQATVSTTAPTAASTSPTTTSNPTPTTTTTAAANGPAICRASDLSASFLGGQAATGHGLLGFALRNASSHACTTVGYPGVQFLTRGGQALPTIPSHTTQDFFGALPRLPLTVSPGSTVSFRLGVTHGAAASTAGCATAYGLQVIPPNDTATLRIAIPNGAYECQTTTVSPVQEGTSAYP